MSRIDYTRHAVTLDEYRRLEPTLTRPLTDVWLRSPRLNTDARLSRLVQPRTRTPTREDAA